MQQENVGQTIDRYKIITLLGEGGMGSVYKASDLTLQRDVALKVMHPQFARQTSFQERFLQEARTAARLNHPGIVQVYDFGSFQGNLYIVMEFIPGDNLGQILRRLRSSNNWLPLAEGVGIVRQVALALDYAHHHGVLHRDIKPDNIMLKPEAQDEMPYHPVVTDLGLAKLVEGGIQTQDGTSMGTPAYMSPEQALGQPTDARSDVYSLGVLLYELAVARLPFPARSLSEAIRYHTQEPPPPPRSIRSDLPDSLEAVILKTLQKDANARYPSASALASALQGVLPAATQVAEQKTSLGETVSLVTVYQKSLMEPRGPSILNEFKTPSDLSQDRVQVLSGGKTVLSVPIKTSGMAIGRDDTADLRLDGTQVSRNHARITYDGSQYFITDLNSTNGTFLDNTRLLPGVREPWPADKAVRVGAFWLRLSLAAPSARKFTSPQAVVDAIGSSGSGAGTVGAVGVGAGPSLGASQATVQLDGSQFAVDPGSAVTIPVTLVNQGALVDHYSLTVTGIPGPWVGTPPQRINLLPGESKTTPLTIRPPRSAGAHAGSYSVQLGILSESTNRTQNAAAFTMVVNPFSQFTSTLHPERVRAGKTARLTIQNQGNAREFFNVAWQDRADELIFRPPQAQVEVPEGQAVEISFNAVPRQTTWLGGETVHSFNVQVTPASEATQPASGTRAHSGELVSRGLIPVWVIPVLMALCVLLGGAGIIAFTQLRGQQAAQASQTQVAAQAAVATLTAAVQAQSQPIAATPAAPASTTAPTVNNQPTNPPAPTTAPAGGVTAPTTAPQPLVAKIVQPAGQDPITKALIFQVQAYDPAAGTKDGAGITNVEMRVLDAQGKVVHQHNETNAAYCAYGGGEPDCTPFIFANSAYRWDKGQKIEPGSYTLQAVVHAASGQTANVETKVTLQPLKRVAFISEQNGGRDIYTIYEDGSDLNRLTKDLAVDCCLAWSPSGQSLLFDSKKDGNSEIYVVDADGSKVKNLTQNGGFDGVPVWSPDGKRIAFISNRQDGQTSQVFVMDADGSNLKPLTNTPGNKNGLNWSPDSQRLIYAVDQSDGTNGNWNINVINRDGSGDTPLTSDTHYDGAPAWSPDGKRIAFISSRDGNTFKPFVMNADGSNQQRLVDAVASGILALWSADSQKILFYGQNATTGRALFIINGDGTGLKQITPPGIDPGFFAWSADNRQLVISSGYDIVVVNLESASQTQLTKSQNIIDDDPVWQP